MKRLITATAILSAALLSGCSENADLADADRKIAVTKLGGDTIASYRKVTAEGHDYIVAACGYGVSIVHSESCARKSRRRSDFLETQTLQSGHENDTFDNRIP